MRQARLVQLHAAGTESATRRCRAGCRRRERARRRCAGVEQRSRAAARATISRKSPSTTVTFGGARSRAAPPPGRDRSRTPTTRRAAAASGRVSAPGPGPISRNVVRGCGAIARDHLVDPGRARGSAGRTASAPADGLGRSVVVVVVAAPVLLFDLLDLFLAQAEVVADLVDERLADRDDRGRRRPRPRARAAPGRAGCGRAARCRSPSARSVSGVPW